MNLTDIKAAVEKKYAALPVTWEDDDGKSYELVLRNVMRMGEKDQTDVQALASTIQDGSDDVSTIRSTMKRFLELLSGDVELAGKFVETIGDDLAIMAYVVDEYQKVTQAEKASAS